jgi:tetratricopeptide (TPR) repeat protein
MTSSAAARPSRGLRRRTVLLGGTLLALLLGTGTALWFARSSPVAPVPPVVPADPDEPEVTAFVDKSRERVLKEPRSAGAWGSLGQAFLANEMDEESRVCFTEAERLDPGNPRWPYCHARALLKSGKSEAALPYLRRATERCAAVEPDNPAPRLRLAETLLGLGHAEEAEEHFQQVLAQQPDDPRTHFGLALAASGRADWQSSRSHLLLCLDSPLTRQKASVQLAAVCQRLGQEADAEKYRQQANRLPQDGDWNDPFVNEYLRLAVKKISRYRLIDSLAAAGELREAMALVQPLLKQYPDDSILHLRAGQVLGRMGEYRRAVAHLREARRLAPDQVEILSYLGLALFNQGEESTRKGDPATAAKLYREAFESARQALALKPDSGIASLSLGLSLERLGQRADALAALRQAVRGHPEYPDMHFHLGRMLAAEGQHREAREQLQEAVQMASPRAPWRQTALDLIATCQKDPPTPTRKN